MPGLRRWNWLDPTKAQDKHLIHGTPIEDQQIGALDSAIPFRDDPMGDVTKGVGDGKFLPATYEERVRQDKALVADESNVYGAIGDIVHGKTMKLSAESFTSKSSDNRHVDENPDGPIFPGANDGH